VVAAGQAFPRRQRLCRRRDFLRVQRTGEKHMMRHFLVFVAPAPEAEPTVRLGITVTRRVGGAVVRNRIKRLVREAFRRLHGRFMEGFDMVWIAKNGSGAIGFGEVEADMTALGERLARRRPRSTA
jgi:ribonuclease P protein component